MEETKGLLDEMEVEVDAGLEADADVDIEVDTEVAPKPQAKNKKQKIKYKSGVEYDAVTYWKRLEKLAIANESSRRGTCNAIGIPTSTVITLKRAKNYPRAEMAYEIAHQLGTTVEYMVTGVEKYDYDSDLQNLLTQINELPKYQKKIMKNIIQAQLTYWESVNFNDF